MTTDTTERLGAVPLDLALRDRPRLAHEAGAQLPPADLSTQRRRRQPESGCRLCEREHLAKRVDDARIGQDADGVCVYDFSGVSIAAARTREGYADHRSDWTRADQLAVGAVWTTVLHLVSLRAAVGRQNVRAIAYVVKGSIT